MSAEISTEKTAEVSEDMKTDTTDATNGDSEKPKPKCHMIYIEPLTWEDVISPEIQAFAKKALRFHVSLHPNKETGVRVGGTRFVLAEQKDLDEIKNYMKPLTKKNAEIHKVRERLIMGMVVYPTDTNETKEVMRTDSLIKVYIQNIPENANVELLKRAFPKAKDISILPLDESEGVTERTGLIRCRTTPEAVAYVERADGMFINDTELCVLRFSRKQNKKANKKRKADSDRIQNEASHSESKKSLQLPEGGEVDKKSSEIPDGGDVDKKSLDLPDGGEADKKSLELQDGGGIDKKSLELPGNGEVDQLKETAQ